MKKFQKVNLTWLSVRSMQLLQLGNSFDVDVMYGDSYGYMSSLNPHMIKHLKLKSEKLKKISKLSKNDIVIDIGSNDGTTLGNYEKSNILIGIDPTIKKLKNFIEKILSLYLSF